MEMARNIVTIFAIVLFVIYIVLGQRMKQSPLGIKLGFILAALLIISAIAICVLTIILMV